MERKFNMTTNAQRALWSKLSNESVFIPSLFLVEGAAKEGYAISYVDAKLCGFPLISVKSFAAVKFIVNQLNETGKTDYAKHCSVGSFAWSHIDMPTN